MAARAPKHVRNLTRVTVRLRFGSKKEPYHVELQPRGRRGDVQAIPADLTDHPAFLNSQGLTFEVINKTQANAIDYGADSGVKRHPIYDNIKVTVEKDSDTERVVARYNLSERGRIHEVERARNEEGLGPKRAAVPGSEDGANVLAVPEGHKVMPDLPKRGGIERG